MAILVILFVLLVIALAVKSQWKYTKHYSKQSKKDGIL